MKAYLFLFAAILLAQCGRAPYPPLLRSALYLHRSCSSDGETCILVDTRERTLRVVRGRETLYLIPRVALSPEGPGIKVRRGDGIVPLGTFRLARILKGGTFGTFLQIDYPSLSYVEAGLRRGLISKDTASKILRALDERELPPQGTALGGQLGIHALGSRSREIHRISDWTRGCIAIENEEMEQLLQYISLGMEISIF